VTQFRHDSWQRAYSEYLIDLLQTYGVDLIVDAGAHNGRFARGVRQAGFQGQILSFEPVQQYFDAAERAALRDDRWIVLPIALGDFDGQTTINVSAGTGSSILSANAYGKAHFSDLRTTSRQVVEIRRLATILTERRSYENDRAVFIKMDTQGYDLNVLRGLGDQASRISIFQSEMSVIKIYDDMPSMSEALVAFETAGFEPTAFFPVTTQIFSGRVVEFDCIMVNRDEARRLELNT